MKNHKIIAMSLIASAALAITGCGEDFLDHPKNTTSLNQETFFDSDDAINQATAPLYNYVWSNFNGKLYYSMGDGRANNITAQYSDYLFPFTNFNEGGNTPGLYDGWGALYSVVSQCNNVILNINKYCSEGAGVSAEGISRGLGEARFMRGVAYWYLASLWGDVMIYKSAGDLVDNYVLPTYPRVDVMEYAIRDLEFAAVNLPAVGAQPGRINKYTAYGMLSRVYLSMAGLTTDGAYDGSNISNDFSSAKRNPYYLEKAKKAAKLVIEKSTYRLMDNYADLFKIANNNCSEDMFQLQWNQGSTDANGWGCNQDITAFFGWSTMVTDGTNWGGSTYCSWDLFKEFNEESGDKRKRECIATHGDSYPEFNVKGGGYIYGETEQDATQGVNIKKYVVGTNADNGISYKQSSGINTHMLRLAEVYLNYVEACLSDDAVGSVDDADAIAYFNVIRKRAGLSAKRSISYQDYRKERRKELAFEGQYWYDLVRRAYYQQEQVVAYVNNQDRNRSYKYDAAAAEDGEETVAHYTRNENPGTGVSEATATNLLLPYPEADAAVNEYLTHSYKPEHYQFEAREVTDDQLF